MWNKKNFVKLWQIHEISASFFCYAFISPEYAQILKYPLMAWWQLLETLPGIKSNPSLKVKPANEPDFSLILAELVWLDLASVF